MTHESQPQKRTFWIGVQGRFVLRFSIAYIFLFGLLYTLFYYVAIPNILAFALTDQPDSIRAILLDALRARVQVGGLLIFVVSYAIFVMMVMIVSRRLAQPVIQLAEYARRVEKGDYTPTQIPTFWRSRDEIDLLFDAFSKMVEKVHEREDKLKQQVATMQITIDKAKRETDVNNIVNSDYFAKLKATAKEMKEQRPKAPSEDS